MILHITNGSAVIDKMRKAGLRDRIVPWNDVLHEGPVPGGLDVAALRDVRAEFIASGAESFAEVSQSFAERDRALEELGGIDEIVLWFEHDLYDQLQLIQVLEQLPSDDGPLITAVPGDDYLSTQPLERFTGLFPARREITAAQRMAARDAWKAFRSQDPPHIVDVLDRVTALPHLAPALRRHLQQFPSVENGLSRTEQQALEALARGVAHMKDVYVESNHKREEAVFMGDLPFVDHIRRLMESARPLITTIDTGDETGVLSLESEIALTDDGRRVLEGAADRVTLCGIDRWLGGTHLTGHGPVWRWDQARQTVRVA